MAKDMTIDTAQLDLLSDNLALFPRELAASIKASLKAGTMASLKTVVPKYYNIRPAKLSSTHTIRTAPYTKGAEDAVQFVVSGRRLTPAHFSISPLKNMYRNPLVEIIKGEVKRTGEQMGADGKPKDPFVMFTRTKSGGRVSNVFVSTGRPQKANKKKEALRSYRTVSVPQMLFHPAVADEVQQTMLDAFDKALFKQIERKTQLMQENILKG